MSDRAGRRHFSFRAAVLLLVLAILVATIGSDAARLVPPGQLELAQAAALAPKQHWGTADAGGEESTGGPTNRAAPRSEQSKFPPVRMPPRPQPKVNASTAAAPTKVTGFDPITSRELPQSRGRHENTFRNTDGTLTTQYSPVPVNFPAPDGSWRPIDTTMQSTEDGWRNTADSVTAQLPRTLAGPAVLRYDEQHEVSIGVADAGPVAGTAAASEVTYPKARPYADVRLSALPGGLSAALRLDGPDAPAEWLLPLHLKGLAARSEGNRIRLVDEKGGVRGELATGLTEGTDNRPADAATVQLAGQALKVSVGKAWLADPARVFPVAVNLAVDAATSNANMVVTDGRRTRNSTTLRVGRNGGYSASYLAFDGLTDPNNTANILGHKIFGAQLWVVNYSAPSCLPQPLTVHAVNEAWGSGSTGYPAFGGALATSSFAHGYIASGHTSSACPTSGEGIDLGVSGRDVVQSWADNGGANFGLTLRAPDNAAAWKTFTGLGTANPPKLFVTHTPYNAEYRIDNAVPDPYVTEGNSGYVKITATNRGAYTWNSDYALAYRAYRDDGSPVDSREAAQIPAGTTVPPGGSITFNARIYSEPSDFHLAAGRYLFDFTMIRRNVANFIDEQIPPARIQLEVFKIPPILTDLYPPNGYASPTLRPALWAKGIHAIPGQSTLQYKVQICDHKTDGNPNNTDAGCVDSGLRDNPTWTVPAGALAWNKTYYWHGWVHDPQGYSPATAPVALLTSVPQPEITSHLGGAADAGAGQDFDPLVGNYLSSAVDAAESVAGPPLAVTRTYNSLDPRRAALFGAGWTTPYDMRLTPDADGSGNVVITYPDGRQNRFGLNPNGTFAAPQGRFASLSTVPAAGGGGWQLVDKEQTLYVFDGTGRLSYISDNLRRHLQLAYDASGHLSTVSSQVSGRTLTFGWTGNHVGTVGTDAVGGKSLVWHYTYDGDKLTEVCDPANHCTAYDYESGTHYRSAVIDSLPDGYWRLGDAPGSATAVSDVKANLGKDNGAYKNVTLGVPGPVAGAATFTGSSSIVLADGQAVKSRNLAVEMWFRTTAAGPLFGHQSSPIGQDSISAVPVLYVGTDGKLRGEFWYGQAAPLVTPEGVPPVNDGRWHHVVLTGAVAGQALYLDGRRVASVDGTIDSAGVTNTQIGAASSGTPAGGWPGWANDQRNQWYFIGDIAEVAYYTHPLGDVAVAAHYAAAQPADLLDKITLPSGRVTSAMTYDTVNDRLRTQIDHNGGLWQLQTPVVGGSTGNPVRTVLVTDPGNRWSQYDYDAFKGRILRFIAPSAADPAPDPQHPVTPPSSAPPCPPAGGDPGDYCGGPVGGGPGWSGGPIKGQGVRTYDYDGNGFQTVITDELGHQVKLGYDDRGNVTAKTTCRTGPGDCQTSYTSYYLNAGNALDPRNDQPTDSRDARSAGPADNTYRTHTDYTAQGQIAATNDANGSVVRYAYTDGSEPAYPVGGGGNMPAGLLKTVTDTRGKVTTYQYYATGDLGQVTNPTGAATRYSYDALGRKTGETAVSDGLPGGAITSAYAYDAESHVVAATSPATKNTVTGVTHTSRTTVGYDADGNPIRSQADDLTGGDVARVSTFDYDDRGRLARTTDPEGKVTSYGYDQFGNTTSVTDPVGNVTAYAYTVRNMVYQVRLRGWTGDPAPPGSDETTPNPDLVLESFSYDLAGHVVRHSDAMGRTSVYAYYQDDLPRSVTAKGVDNSLDIALEQDTYDAAGNLVKKTAAGNRVTMYDIDPAGRILSQTEDPGGLDRKTAYSYDPAGNVLRVTNIGKPSNVTGIVGNTPETTDYTYDDAGRILTEKVANAPAPSLTSRAYFPNGMLKNITDPRGNVTGADPAAFTTTFGYDELGRQITAVSPPVRAENTGGQPTTVRPTTTLGYNAFGDATQSSDPLGRITTTDYDGDSRPVRVTLPSYAQPGSTQAGAPTTSAAYDDGGRVTASADALGRTTRLEYDQLGRVVSKQDPGPDGGVWHYTYTRTGEQLSATDPLGGTVQNTYDDLGRLATTTQLERKPQPAAHTTGYAYNDAGDLLNQTSPSGARTSYTYDTLGQAISSTSPANVVTRHGYDQAGRPAQQTDAAGRTTTSYYDPAGKLLATTDTAPNGVELRTVSTGYDVAGNPTTRTDALGHTSTFAFDALDRLTAQTEPIADGQSITTSFGHDAAGNQTRVTDGRGNATITGYNSLGLAESVLEPSTSAYPNAADRTWTTSYDLAGQPVKLAEPGGVTRQRTFDSLGRLVKETGTGTGATADHVRVYDAAGRLAAVDAPGGQNTFAYSDRGLLLSTGGPSGNSSFAYNGDGQIVTRTDAAGTSSYSYLNGRVSGVQDAVTGTTANVGYAVDGQVAQVSYGSGHVRTFGYDDLGRLGADIVKNSAGATVSAISYGYDSNDRLTSKSGNTYGYDYAGRLASWTDPHGTKTQYSWDAAGNRTSNGALYDARDRLVSDNSGSYTYTARGTLSSHGAITSSFDAFDRLVSQGAETYTYDGLDRVVTRNAATFSYSGTGNTLASDGAAQFARGPSDELLALSQGSDKRFAVADQHGDLIGGFNSADGTGGLVDSTTFDPFGQRISGARRPLGFQGGWTDPDTGQVNMAARWYNPATGAFTSRDDFHVPNRYNYAGGSPLNHSDPSGHCFWDACVGEAIGAVALVGGLIGAATYIRQHPIHLPTVNWPAVRDFVFGERTATFSPGAGIAGRIHAPAPTSTPRLNTVADALGLYGMFLAFQGFGNRLKDIFSHWGNAGGGSGNPHVIRSPVKTDPAPLARALEEIAAQKVAIPVPGSLLGPDFADPKISGDPSLPAAVVAASGIGTLDEEEIWEKLRDSLTDPTHPVVTTVDDVVDSELERIPEPQGEPEEKSKPKVRPRGAPGRCVTNWQHYDEMEPTTEDPDDPQLRAAGAQACVVTTSTKARDDYNMPYSNGYEKNVRMARCHLIGHQLNGSDTDPRNFVACYHDLTNNAWMSGRVEGKIAWQVRHGNPVYMDVTPHYRSATDFLPDYIFVVAVGNDGWSCTSSIPNVKKVDLPLISNVPERC